MNGRIFLRIVLAVILVALLAGAAVFVYNVGVTHGLAASGKLVAPAPGNGMPMAPYYYGGFGRPWGPGFGFGFGFLGLIFPILFLFLVFALVRGAFFHGGGRWHGGRRWYGEGGSGEVPPMVEEWHRKMHEKAAGGGENNPPAA
jgi:hypothetical protein